MSLADSIASHNSRTSALLIFALLVACPALRAVDDPFVGTWKLNLEKSRYSDGPLPISSKNTYEPTAMNLPREVA